MRSSSNPDSKQGQTHSTQTKDTQRDPGSGQAVLYIIGTGPGHPDYMSQRAKDVLAMVDTVAGYTTYIDLIAPLIQNKKVVSTGMKKEVDRVQAAIDIALAGQSCAIICSGDPGIYAMAGLAFEICKKNHIRITRPGGKRLVNDPSLKTEPMLEIEVVPGIPALASGAALLGAPLTHDFAVISLSDLLTPWKIIENRITAAAQADFVIVLFNPKSKKRDWQLQKAQEIVLRFRNGKTPTGIVKNAMRDNQEILMVGLGDLHTADVDMLTTVFIGNSTSFGYLDFMITPRGYANKYDIG